MKFKLICKNDPVALGIESADGSWDMRKFTSHIQGCEACKKFAGILINFILSATIVAQAVAAKKQGRPVFFEGQEYTDLQKWEDAIVGSGQMVTIDRDDETGFWVKAVGPDPDLEK